MTPLEFEQLMAKYEVNSKGRIRYSDFLRHFVLPHRSPSTSLLPKSKLHLPKMPVRWKNEFVNVCFNDMDYLKL